MTHTLFLLSSLLLVSPEDTDPAERLVRAEVLEVAKGDLEKAMAEYRAIEADEKAPPSVRARALLALGRCQRKRGELEAARRTFADVLARHPEEKETGRRAKSFLEEIEKGRPENPDFDWLGDLEKNPEIQARVFELAMVAAGPEAPNTEVLAAVRQLLALGRAALPVLDKVIDVSGDRQHRRRLAAIELHAGRWDRLQMALDGGFPVPTALLGFLESLPRLPEDRRRALLAELDEVPAETGGDLAHLVRLWAGDVSRIAEAVPALRSYPLSRELAARIADAGPAGVEALVAMVLDPQTEDGRAGMCFAAVLEKKPEALSDEAWVAQAERDTGLYAEMERAGRFELLQKLARGRQASQVVNYFWQSKKTNIAGRATLLNPQVLKDPKATDSRWAGVLRSAKAGGFLKSLAGLRDETISEYVAFLRNVEFDDADPGIREQRRGDLLERDRAWMPSDLYLRSMVPLLEHTDPDVVRITLDALSLAEPKGLEDVVPRLEKLAVEASDEGVRLRAIASLITRTISAGDPEKTKRATLLWIAEAERGEDRSPSEDRTPAKSRRTGPRVRTRPQATRPSQDRTARVVGEVFPKIMDTSGLYSSVLTAANEKGSARFHDEYCGRSGLTLPLLIERLEEVTHPDLMASAFLRISNPAQTHRLDESPYDSDSRARILRFLERAAKDTRVDLEVRAAACWLARSFFEWFDWPEFLRSGDPLAPVLIGANTVSHPVGGANLKFDQEVWQAIASFPDEARISIYKAMLESPSTSVRRAGIKRFPMDHPSAAEVLRAGLSDAYEFVRGPAIEVLSGFTRADSASAFAGLLGHPDKRVRVAVLEALTRFADPASIEPMVALLDDPDTEVRSKALEGVKQIRRVLEEKDEWKNWVRQLKTEEAGKEKTSPPEEPAKK